jgi:acyl carrier protein
MFEADERDPSWDCMVDIRRAVQMDMKEGGYESWEDIDSLGKLEILAGVEEQMDVNIPMDAVGHVRSVDEFVEACYGVVRAHLWALWSKGMIPKVKEKKDE